MESKHTIPVPVVLLLALSQVLAHGEPLVVLNPCAAGSGLLSQMPARAIASVLGENPGIVRPERAELERGRAALPATAEVD